nr:MAG TPA: hypothetical protein [Caudoviricetes sp.]
MTACFFFFTYYYDICKSSIIFPNVIDCAKAVMDSIKSAINKETFIKKCIIKDGTQTGQTIENI